MMRTCRNPRGVGRPVLLAVALVVSLAGLVSCSSSTSFQFRCDAQVNGGLLLTVDLVQVNEAEAQQIRQTGDQWFYSDLRRQLELRTRTIAVRGGCTERVALPQIKKRDILAVVADYQFESADRTKGHMQFLTKPEWKGKKLEVEVHDTYIAVKAK
jgi:hypothetical protein